jgi:hypothetical protein
LKIIDFTKVDMANMDRLEYNIGMLGSIAEKYGGVLIKYHRSQTCCRCSKTVPNDTGICRCKELPLIKHHISYFPEIVVKICKDCHDDIHNSDWGAPTNMDGSIDFNEFESGKDYTSGNKEWIMYMGDERDEFYAERDGLKKNKWGKTKNVFVNGVNKYWSSLSSGVGIGLCLECGQNSCSYYGCFIPNHQVFNKNANCMDDCTNMKFCNR